MKENSNNFDNFIKDPIYYPAYSVISGNSTRKKRKYSLNYDINNSEIRDSFDEYYLRFYENEYNFNDKVNENYSLIKLYNLSEKSVSNGKLYELKNKKENVQKKENQNQRYGRKTKNSIEKGIHNKYTSDNIIRKCKSVLLKILSNLINNRIKDFYYKSGNYTIKRNRLMKINQSQVANSNVKFNQQFLYKKLKDIFSDDVSAKCTRYSKDHNKKLINNLLNEKDKIKKKYFSDFLNLTFLECVQHLRGSIMIPCLYGLKNYDEVCEELKGDEDYKETFRCYIDNYEKIIKNKKSRKKCGKPIIKKIFKISK